MAQPADTTLPLPDEVATLSFEKAYARLEEILELLGRQDLPLNRALTLYEEADRLTQLCSERLNQAEKKIEMIVKNREGQPVLCPDGTPQTTPFRPSQDRLVDTQIGPPSHDQTQSHRLKSSP